MVETPKVLSILGLPVHWLNDYSGWLLARLHQGMGAHVVTLNAEMAIQAERNNLLNQVICQADLAIPDGAGVVLYLRFKGNQIRRCPGIELAEMLLQHIGNESPVFFYGGQPGVAEAAAKFWRQRLPGLAIAGTQHGYISDAGEQSLLQKLKDQQPKLILVGLGVPRQEFWIAQHRALCPNAIWIGVGGSFDIWAGVKSRAPSWLRNNHLEWSYRLYQEPWRWRRMLALPQFAFRALMHS
ncbi:MAG: WecB/TagA/CpsF family glycosyltransferase [Cyanothece sp. SIO1E1]|nr:WecB/TagA/CpsF family glycosyltransferase [Cyanothece sp. SIO1E1]